MTLLIYISTRSDRRPPRNALSTFSPWYQFPHRTAPTPISVPIITSASQILSIPFPPSGSLYFGMRFEAVFARSLMVCSYKTSLKANRNAAVKTLWETFGPIPKQISIIQRCRRPTYHCRDQHILPPSRSFSSMPSYSPFHPPYLQHACDS